MFVTNSTVAETCVLTFSWGEVTTEGRKAVAAMAEGVGRWSPAINVSFDHCQHYCSTRDVLTVQAAVCKRLARVAGSGQSRSQDWRIVSVYLVLIQVDATLDRNHLLSLVTPADSPRESSTMPRRAQKKKIFLKIEILSDVEE